MSNIFHSQNHFPEIADGMKKEGLSEVFIRSFHEQYLQLAEGSTGLISESDILPVEQLPDLELIPEAKESRDQFDAIHLSKLVVIKLNGGLGTSMGLEHAKSLLPVKENLSFLDIIVQQILALRKRFDVNFPLVLMNSFRTAQDSLDLLARYPDFISTQPSKITTSFLQHKVPKIIAATGEMAKWAKDPSLEWCPPGHGDIYSSLIDTGLLTHLLDLGIEYAFISNADNLGATVSRKILSYLINNDIPFLMEVADRTGADRKGGHLALSRNDNRIGNESLLLREIAQCPEADMDAFQNISRHKYFNTNSIWLNLKHLQDVLDTNNSVMPLPLIRNLKNLDPNDPTSPRVFQLETAMGAAISCFPRSAAIRVPRTRFAPVKKTDDLLVLWSDNFVFNADREILPNPNRKLETIIVNLDERYFKSISEFKRRFSFGSPSLLECKSLVVTGDVYFGPNVKICGEVTIINKADVPLVLDNITITESICRD